MVLANSDAPDPATVGESLTYTLTVANRLTTATSGVKLTDRLPGEVSFASVTTSQGSCAQARSTVTCKLGKIPGSGTASVIIKVSTTAAGIVTNTATVESGGAELTPGDNTAAAETQVSAPECGQVVTTTTVLTNDIGPCAGNGVIIGADRITLDLGGHRIFGFPGPADGAAAGIRLPMRVGVRVHNGTVSDFDAGVVIRGGGSNTVTNLTVRDNVGPDDVFNSELGDGIFIENSALNRLSNNSVLHNGVFDGIGIYGELANGNIVENNVVADTVGPSDAGPAGQGIIVNGASGTNPTTVEGTVIAGNVVRNNGSAGIANVNHVNGIIRANIVEANGMSNAQGNGIGVQLGPQSVAIATRMLIEDNQVHRNARNGIVIRVLATENQILRNDAADNNVLGPESPPDETLLINPEDDPRGIDVLRRLRGADGPVYDLHDQNAACAGNIWFANRWGTGGYSHVCVTAGSVEQ